MSIFGPKLFIPNLDDKLGLLKSIRPASESCSVTYRGKLYVYGQGLTNFHFFLFSSFFA